MRLIVAFLLIALTMTPPVLAAQQEVGIAAIVGDEAISQFDVDSRTRFVIATTKLSNTPDVIARIRPQIIQTLIDERLQIQEARNLGIEIADGEIGPAIEAIERRQGKQSGDLFKELSAKDVAVETFAEQIRAQLAWNKLLLKVARPRVKVDDDEVARMQRRVLAPSLNQEWQIGVLNLPINKPQRKGEIEKLAEKLVSEVRAGANFEEVARQFSQQVGAADVAQFWVKPDQLDPALMKVLSGIKSGEVTDPVPAKDRLTIVKLYNVRAIKTEGGTPSLPALSQEEEDRIKNFIFQQKMQLEAEKYLRNLRRASYIELR